MAISREEISQIAKATADEVMERVSLEREERELCDHLIGGAMGKGAIPLYGRETRKEPCSCCLIDPEGPNAPENRMCTTKGAIGTLKDSEEREWCSEIKIVSDGRCARARSIREAARVCKEKYPEDTAKFFECYAPAFSKITRGKQKTTGGSKWVLEQNGNIVKEFATEEEIWDYIDALGMDLDYALKYEGYMYYEVKA